MSSYLNIYLVKKESSKDSPLLFMSFSRNHPIYRAVVEAIAPVWAGNEDDYTELTYDNLTECINSLDEETNHIVNKIVKFANMLTASGVTLCNDITAIKEFPRNINYKYYIKEANKILAKLKIQEQGLFW